MGSAKIDRPPSTYLKEFYYDTVNFNQGALKLAIDFAGADHTLAGSDYPHQIGSIPLMIEAVDTLPEWRGRGLSTWLKADMIDWLRRDRPAVDRVTSTINARNDAMLAVCARLGFREVRRRQLITLSVAGPM